FSGRASLLPSRISRLGGKFALSIFCARSHLSYLQTLHLWRSGATLAIMQAKPSRHLMQRSAMPRIVLAIFSLAALGIVPLTALEGAPPARPNVVLILADDLGWTDL